MRGGVRHFARTNGWVSHEFGEETERRLGVWIVETLCGEVVRWDADHVAQRERDVECPGCRARLTPV